MTTGLVVKFLHVLFVATWFGGISMMAMVLRDATRSNNLDTMSRALNRAQRWNMGMFMPLAVLALITGIYMMMQVDGEMPLWLIVKERLGSVVVLLFILFVVIYGRKALNQVQTSGIESAKAQSIIKRYIMLLYISLLLMAVLIFFATVKLA
jgi:protoporphyrinogen IX oxidase